LLQEKRVVPCAFRVQPVTAPADALDTSFAYLAIAPVS
jgi:hypothetical protein